MDHGLEDWIINSQNHFLYQNHHYFSIKCTSYISAHTWKNPILCKLSAASPIPSPWILQKASFVCRWQEPQEVRCCPRLLEALDRDVHPGWDYGPRLFGQLLNTRYRQRSSKVHFLWWLHGSAECQRRESTYRWKPKQSRTCHPIPTKLYINNRILSKQID